MANLGFEYDWHKIGGVLYRTEVGDKYIYEAIQKKEAILGGEQSGHILSKINEFSGDGILTAIQIAKICKNKNITLQDWLKSSFKPFPQKLTNINLNFNFRKINDETKKLFEQIIKNYSENLSEDCRVYVRPSGTEPLLRILVEAKNENQVKALSRELTAKLTSEIDKISNNL